MRTRLQRICDFLSPLKNMFLLVFTTTVLLAFLILIYGVANCAVQ